jgi:uncharacterized protein YgiM (DUF1202 family)
MRKARVILPYVAETADPIAVKEGETVTIDDTRKTDCAGWVWCTSRAGRSGWVPLAFLRRSGDRGTVSCDYDAVELTVRIGDVLSVHKEESGFLWAVDSSGLGGWVPSDHVSFETE